MNVQAPSPLEDRKHTIRLEDLIVHRYSERAVLLRKADKIAQDIIRGEMREGEKFRTPEPGVYVLAFPKLKPEAGALRCSLLAERIAREIRKINPAVMAIDRATMREPQPRARFTRRQAAAPAARPARAEPPRAGADQAAPVHAAREAATRAFERMIDTGQTSQVHELALTEHERATFAGMRLSFHPVWHVRNRLITGYRCALSMNGQDLTARETALALDTENGDIAKAKIDAMIYANAVAGIQNLLQSGQKALLIVPIHFSTIDHMRFMVPLLDAGASLPADAQSLVVFEILDIPQNTSHFRLREPMAYLRTRSRALIGRIGFDFTSLDAFRELSFHGISLDMGDYKWNESRLLPFFETFTQTAQKQKLQPFVHGIRSASLTVAAISAGFSYIGGPAVAAPLTAPERAHPFAVESLYADLSRRTPSEESTTLSGRWTA